MNTKNQIKSIENTVQTIVNLFKDSKIPVYINEGPLELIISNSEGYINLRDIEYNFARNNLYKMALIDLVNESVSLYSSVGIDTNDRIETIHYAIREDYYGRNYFISSDVKKQFLKLKSIEKLSTSDNELLKKMIQQI